MQAAGQETEEDGGDGPQHVVEEERARDLGAGGRGSRGRGERGAAETVDEAAAESVRW